MNVDQLKVHLNYLIDKYISEPEVRHDLTTLIKRAGIPPVKNIMATIESEGRSIEQMDVNLVKDIAFYYL